MIANPERYRPGGDLYTQLVTVYGVAAADNISAVVDVDDGGAAFRAALSDAKRGNTNTNFDQRGTLELFLDQLTTDPLAAPLASANSQIQNVVLGVFKNPFVLGAIVLLIAWKLGFLAKLKAR